MNGLLLTSTLPYNSSILSKEMTIQQEISPLIDNVREWAKSAPDEELSDRSRVASLIIDAIQMRSTALTLGDLGKITESPPFPPWLTELSICGARVLTTWESLPSGLTRLHLAGFPSLRKLPEGSYNKLTYLNISGGRVLTELPIDLSDRLDYLGLNWCRELTALPHFSPSQNITISVLGCDGLRESLNHLPLPANVTCVGAEYLIIPTEEDLEMEMEILQREIEDQRSKIEMDLNLISVDWVRDNDPYDAQNLTTFKDYFLSMDRMWGTQEAQNDPIAFGEKQCCLLRQMQQDPELRQVCFNFATAGMADCKDNAAAMFLAMQEKALEIKMHRPDASKNDLIEYCRALENQSILENLLRKQDQFRNVTNSDEGLEAKLWLLFLCHEVNIPLPVPCTAMAYENVGQDQVRQQWDMEISDFEVHCQIIDILQQAMPYHPVPETSFLVAQSCWQAFIDRTNSGKHLAAKETIEKEKEEKIASIEASMQTYLKASHAKEEIDMEDINYAHQLLAIKHEADQAIAKLYLPETGQLLKNIVIIQPPTVLRNL